MERLHLLSLALLLVVPLYWCHGHGHEAEGFRGPHHPRSSHSHHVPSHDGDKQTKLTQDKQLLHDKEHLKEDLGEWLFEDGKEMTPEEMEFHYFKTHDFDNNSKLDGLEILQAISHILPMNDVAEDGAKASGGATSTAGSHQHGHSHHSHSSHQDQSHLTESQKTEMKKQRDEEFNYYIDLIDTVLKEDDLNQDGYLSYVEYSIGRRREEAASKAAAGASVVGKTR